MAKIAGRKNNGAWYRTNKDLKALTSGERADLATNIQNIETLGDFFSAVQSALGEAGVSSDNWHSSAADLASALSNGIPLAIWRGVPTYDKYDRSGAPGAYTYTPQIGPKMFSFAKDLRKAVTEYLFLLKEAKDLKNSLTRAQGNMGGIADANKAA